MKVAFYAIDESDCSDTKMVSMTGVLVPFCHYQDVAGTIYRFVNDMIPGDTMHPNPPELHASSLLKEYDWATDEHRLGCFRMAVKLVNRLMLKVKRAAYLRHSVKELLKNDPKLQSLNFANMNYMIQRELEEYVIIPVFDGLDERIGTRIGAQGQSLTAMYALGFEKSLTIQPPHNMCEPLFTSSKHSALVQLADLISYLLHTLDFEYRQKTVSEFKIKLQQIARTLDDTLVDNQIKEMNAST